MTLVSEIPELMKDWDWEKNEVSPDEITCGMHKQICRKCHKCGYRWESRVDTAVKSKHIGCPVCRKDKFVDLFPSIASEFDVEKNIGVDINTLSPSSNKKLWWKCSKGHKWEAFVYNRTKRGDGCPYCSGKLATEENNLLVLYPDVIKYWDCDKNSGLDPKDVLPMSNKKVWWVCTEGHSYYTAVFNWTRKHGCTYCLSTSSVSLERSVYYNYIELVEIEWDYSKNKTSPKKVGSKSNKKYWWLCSKGHSWQATPNNRTTLGRGCPYCTNQKVCDDNRLSLLFPHLLEEWDWGKNKKGPEEYTSGSGSKVNWVCKTCAYCWKATIVQRTSKGTQCPKCAYGINRSKVGDKWLDSVGVSEEFREYTIFIKGRKFVVDGFDPETNMIYEFLGDFWHGNPDLYESDKMNRKVGKTFGDLNTETMDRLSLLKGAGFNVFYIWEKDFKALKREKE